MLPLGILTHSLAPKLPNRKLERCIQAWQQCQLDAQLNEALRRHKLWPTLEYCLRKNQLWDYVPSVLQNQLSQNRQQCAIRQLQLISQLEELDAALTPTGKQVILLKGGALVFYPIYPSLGDRLTADIDILVKLEDIPVLVQVLEDLGYTCAANYLIKDYILSDDYTNSSHLPPFDRGRGVPIEVHPTVSLGGMQQPISFWLTQSAQALEEFPSLLLPSVTELFWHILWHAWFNLPQLRNLLDVYQLRHLYKIDLLILEQRADSFGLHKTWLNLMRQIDELSQGKLAPKTILTWEWQPSSQHYKYFIFWTRFRTGRNRWQEMFKVAHQRWVCVPAAILQTMVIIWWLYHYLLVSIEWWFNLVRLDYYWHPIASDKGKPYMH